MDKSLIQNFGQIYASSPQIISSAPGRINLIGEHTDYNHGYVLPAAIQFRNYFLASKSGEDRINVYTRNFDETDSFPISQISLFPKKKWANYIRGIFWVLEEEGFKTQGIDGFLCGDIPLNAGLSSSAAFEICVLLGLNRLFSLELSREDIARMAQRVETECVGVQSGLMDQYVSLFGKKGNALFLDCESLEHELIPVRLEENKIGILVYESGVRRELASSEYNRRRLESDRSFEFFKARGARTYKDAKLEVLEEMKEALGGIGYQRARHVITENHRVKKAVQALKRDDFQLFGDLMFQSHQSLRDDYHVSCPELDLLHEVGRSFSGCLGARLTGAGFGGSGIALLEKAKYDAFKEKMRGAAHERGFPVPRFHEVEIGDGARIHILPPLSND